MYICRRNLKTVYMKKKLFICGLSALMIGGISCKSKQKDAQGDDTESVSTTGNMQNSLDWDGFYTGVLPCADCSGIQVSLELSKDQTFKLKWVYLSDDDNSIDYSGKIVWDKDGKCITLDGVEDMSQFVVTEDALIMLDLEGNIITGDLAEHYILTKTDPNLVEKYWKLMELSGEPVIVPAGGKEAHLIFKKEDNCVNGYGGCNTFNGIYTLKPGNKIAFLQIVSTLAMCLNMDTETKMKQVFETADNYAVSGDTLVLNSVDMTPLARFEAVYME
jgi:heat shock protein HslJ